MARTAAGAREHVLGACRDALPRAEQGRAVEVALDPAVVADPFPGDVERNAPVDPDHVAAHLRALLEQVRVTRGEVDRRDVDRRQHARRVGRRELAVVG